MFLILAVIYVIFISLGLPDSVFGVTWPVIHPEFGIAESFASVYSVIVGACTSGVSFFAGPVLRRFGTAKVSVVSILLTVIGLVGMSFSRSIWGMIVWAVILGYGAGAIDTGLNSFVSLHYKARHMSFLHAFWGIGVTLSPMIMSFFLGEGGNWRNGYRTIALIQTAILIFALCCLKKWEALEHSALPAAEEASDAAGEKLRLRAMPGVVLSILSLGLYCSMEFLLGTWGGSFLVNAYGLDPDVAARWVSLYYGGIMLGRLTSGFIGERLGDERLIRAGILFSLGGMLILLLPFGAWSYVGLLPIGFGFGPIFPSVLHAVPFRFGRKFAADLTGFHMGGAYVLGFATQLIVGFIATRTTFRIIPWVLLCYAGLLALVNALAAKKAARRGNGQE